MIKSNIRMQRDIFSGNIAVQLVQEMNNGLYLANPIQLIELKEGEYAPPFMNLTPTESQQMIDELWNCGIRPSEGTGSAGSLAATERHLSDMQQIAKALLNKQGCKI